MRYFIISMLLLAAFFYNHAIYADPTEEAAPVEDEGWIDEYNDALTIRLSVQRPWQSILLEYRGDGSSSAKDICYQPNTMSNQGIEIAYMDFSLSYHRILINSGEDENAYGSTEYSDYQLHYYGRKMAADLYYQLYEGFYLDDPGDFGLTAGDAGTIRQDLKTSLIGGNFFYFFSNNFSYSAAFNQAERQKKSSGTALLSISFTILELSSSSTLIPANEQTNYGTGSDFSKAGYITLALSGGYAYTLVLGKIFYLTASAFAGIGATNLNYEKTNGGSTRNHPFFKLNGRFAGGMNHDNIFFGAAFTIDKNIVTFVFENEGGVAINTDLMNVSFFLGTRFDIPRFFKM
ncbi:MAG: DUF4421 domain-containing protein [bacterium]|nr:DUF4421 domain-containing protein [bacterium]